MNNSARPVPSQEELQRLFDYDPETGVLTRKVRRGNQAAGRIAGCIDTQGYRRVWLGGVRKVAAHRLVWCYVKGDWPPAELQIDHINGVKDDNRIANLRLATNGENQANGPAYRNSISGIKGVHLIRSTGKWRATIRAEGRMVHLGVFTEKADAIAARVAATQKYHGEFAYQGAAA